MEHVKRKLLCKHFSNGYHVAPLRTSVLKPLRKDNSTSLVFPYMYFNAYFPEFDTYRNEKSVLDVLHDYNIMHSYVKGLSQQQTIYLI